MSERVKKRQRIGVKQRVVKKKSHPVRNLFFAVLFLLVCASAIWFFLQLAEQKPANAWVEAKSIAIDGAQVTLPKDEAPHTAIEAEVWTYHGRLIAESGKRYGFHYSTFLSADTKSKAFSHVSFADFQTDQHYLEQFRNEEKAGFGVENHFYFSKVGRLMLGGDNVDHLKLQAKEFSFDLTLKKPATTIYHGTKGVVPMGDFGYSNYYSRSRLKVGGTVTFGGKTEAVAGVAWFDHQWGDFSTRKLSWDWMGLQLADGSDVMLYQLRDATNKVILKNGSFTQNGMTEQLLSSDFTLKSLEQWTSSKTNIAYPIAWKVIIPDKKIEVGVRSVMKNNEVNAKQTTGSIYWSGAIDVDGSHTGQGFMNLQRYVNKR